MISVKIMGGLGNQMFQYAAGQQLAKLHSTELQLDTSWFGEQAPQDTPRFFELDQCKIDATISPQGIKHVQAKSRVLRKLEHSLLKKPTVYTEQGFPFQPQVLKLPNNSALVGYFQSEQYFQGVRSTLLQHFSPAYTLNPKSRAALKEIKNAQQSVSLHVRRGDYISNKHAQKFHGLTGLAYYRAAMEHIELNTTGPLKVFVFSDDLDWCQKNFRFKHPITFVDGAKKSFDDIWLMSHCHHQIIANSSFSWWGAWLNTAPSKVVVAPKQWFKDPTVDTRDVVPEAWARI